MNAHMGGRSPVLGLLQGRQEEQVELVPSIGHADEGFDDRRGVTGDAGLGEVLRGLQGHGGNGDFHLLWDDAAAGEGGATGQV